VLNSQTVTDAVLLQI